MRTIKFRAWDKMQKKMSYSVSVYSEPDEECWWSADHINPDTGDTICAFDVKFGELMEFTGLKDRKGKEIFDGDILSDDEFYYNVHWNTRSAGWAIKRRGWLHDHFFNEAIEPGEVEIAGNIYENGNLLESKPTSQGER